MHWLQRVSGPERESSAYLITYLQTASGTEAVFSALRSRLSSGNLASRCAQEVQLALIAKNRDRDRDRPRIRVLYPRRDLLPRIS